MQALLCRNGVRLKTLITSEFNRIHFSKLLTGHEFNLDESIIVLRPDGHILDFQNSLFESENTKSILANYVHRICQTFV
ncbi:hypothetical protein BdWA1_000825 [Babesia duncani]|uniref:Uncharacterized protein n=1 Tax=Babesia duncani TaxID=323732 RepID=A0AAD9PNU2_9APIC|nr:hypothetical protein BdWA1_000825 [Babesia duncani]